MPRGDKTGPDGKGSMTGRKMGFCTGNKQAGCFSTGSEENTMGRGLRKAHGRRHKWINKDNN